MKLMIYTRHGNPEVMIDMTLDDFLDGPRDSFCHAKLVDADGNELPIAFRRGAIDTVLVLEE